MTYLSWMWLGVVAMGCAAGTEPANAEKSTPEQAAPAGPSGPPAGVQAEPQGQAPAGAAAPAANAQEQPQLQPPTGHAVPVAGAEEPLSGFQKLTKRADRAIQRTTGELVGYKDSLSRLVQETRQKESQRQQLQEPQKSIHPIQSYREASVCQSTWEEMTGTDRYRICKQCSLCVYDFTKLELPEAEALVFRREGISKPAFYRRQDGRFMTRDCPVGVQAGQKRMALVTGLMLLAIVLSVLIALPFLLPRPPKPTVIIETPPATKTTPSLKKTPATTPETAPEAAAPTVQAPFQFPETRTSPGIGGGPSGPESAKVNR